MSKVDESISTFPGIWGQNLKGLSEQMRTGPMAMARIGQMATQTSQVIAARHTQHLTEAVADITVLFRDATPKPNDPASAMRAYSAFVQSSLRRNLSLLSFYAETIAGMAEQVSGPHQTSPDPHAHDHAAGQTTAPKPNGRAVGSHA